MSDLLSHFQQQLSGYPDTRRWVVGLSGGLDSVVLLQLAVQTLPPGQLRVIHINHQLQDQAAQWQRFCEALCRRLGLALDCYAVVVPTGASIERAARDARYRVFESSLQADECLLLAQHRDDQAETLLYRLLRGAGVKGLAAMPRSRPLGQGMLLRPLLDLTREQLLDWAREQPLKWVEDPSNADDRYDRNYLRQHVLPRLAQRWPGFTGRWAQTAEHLAEADQLLCELAEIDQQDCLTPLNSLQCRGLMALSRARRNNLLRYWVYNTTGVAPGRDWLQRVVSEVVLAAADGQPELVLGGLTLRRFRDQLFLIPEHEPVVWQDRLLSQQGCALRQGRLLVEPGAGVGLESLARVRVRNRREGDRCRPAGRDGTRSLKKLFQEHSIPPWLRDSWPVCVVDDEIVAVPGICICDGWQNEKKGAGFALKWQPFALFETGDSGTL